MVAVNSTMMALGTAAPAFSLPTPDGEMVSNTDFAGKPLLVMFICNHCPFVQHIAAELADLGRTYGDRGVGVVAIQTNDVANYPDDGPEKMKAESADRGYVFPYVYDETQDVSKAYGAACTPDFFLFDADRKLVYRGQFDASRPRNDIAVSGEDLNAAVAALVEDIPISVEQIPSLGCNVKWKAGNEPEYFNS